MFSDKCFSIVSQCNRVGHGALVVVESKDQSKARAEDQKVVFYHLLQQLVLANSIYVSLVLILYFCGYHFLDSS